MQQVSFHADSILELLNMIVRFTRSREEVLINNIRSVEEPGFAPQDLDTADFSEIVDAALTEYLTLNRLILRDTASVQFGPEGSFHVVPAVDENAVKLMPDRDAYIRYQARKLAQNLTNASVALRLIQSHTSNLSFPSGRRCERDVA